MKFIPANTDFIPFNLEFTIKIQTFFALRRAPYREPSSVGEQLADREPKCVFNKFKRSSLHLITDQHFEEISCSH